MFEKVFSKFGYNKSITPESALDLIASSERRNSGWVRTLDGEGRFLGFRFYCPGRFIKATRPTNAGERDAAGNALTGEVAYNQRVGCAFVTGEILPLQTLSDVQVRCGQCGVESILMTWMRENKINSFDAIPSEQRAPSRSSRQFIELGGDDMTSTSYAQSDPGGV